MESLYPGKVIGVRVGLVTHKGIVSGRNSYGEWMVISNSKRAGGVYEEPLSVFQGRYKLVPVKQPLSDMPTWLVLVQARKMLGARWDVSTWNCEHFVNYAFGLKLESPQLQAAVAMLGIAGIAIMVARSA